MPTIERHIKAHLAVQGASEGSLHFGSYLLVRVCPPHAAGFEPGHIIQEIPLVTGNTVILQSSTTLSSGPFEGSSSVLVHKQALVAAPLLCHTALFQGRLPIGNCSASHDNPSY
jgi:hypothetical protein